jgi:hypothetical protein
MATCASQAGQAGLRAGVDRGQRARFPQGTQARAEVLHHRRVAR